MSAEILTRVIPQEVEAEKARLRKLGIAKYTISGLSEDESIASTLRAERSSKFVAVRSEFTKRFSKNKSFRVFALDPERPTIPMGYYGAPKFTFDSNAVDPRDGAIKKLKEVLATKGIKVVQVRKFNNDEFSYKTEVVNASVSA